MRDLLTSQPLVSFVVLSWNTKEDTLNCIKNLKDHNYSNYEIIVVDNGSKDGSKTALAKLRDITYIDLPQNTGFTGGQIAALQHAKGDFIALINSDAVIDKQWVSVCLETFSSIKNTAVVGGRAYTWKSDADAFNTSVPFYSYQSIDPELGYATTHTTGSVVMSVDSISGAAVMISREVIRKVGYFDNMFFAYYEETDLFARFQRAGYKIIYQPNAHAWHMIGKSTSSKPYFYLYHMYRNRFQYAYKNFDATAALRKSYFKHGWLSTKLYFLESKSLENKAAMSAYWWIIFHYPSLYIRRKNVIPLGKTYTELVKKRKKPSDVTIIIPSYNYGRYLSATIKSCLRQSHPPTQIIVIDDGSTDNSVEIAQSFRQVETIVKKNEGVVRTKNLGIKLSQSTWTLFLDADDTLPRNYLEQMLKTAHEKNGDVVYSDAEFFGAKKGRQIAQDYSFDRLRSGNFIHNSSLIRTESLQANPYKTEMSHGYEDWELYLSLATKGNRFTYATSTALNYRQHRNGIGRNVGAVERAELLFNTVRQLHPELYNPAPSTTPDITLKVKNQLIRHPSILIVTPIFLLTAVVASIQDYIKAVGTNTSRYVRTYIHWRDN